MVRAFGALLVHPGGSAQGRAVFHSTRFLSKKNQVKGCLFALLIGVSVVGIVSPPRFSSPRGNVEIWGTGKKSIKTMAATKKKKQAIKKKKKSEIGKKKRTKKG